MFFLFLGKISKKAVKIDFGSFFKYAESIFSRTKPFLNAFLSISDRMKQKKYFFLSTQNGLASEKTFLTPRQVD